MDRPCQMARFTDGMLSAKPTNQVECERNYYTGSTNTANLRCVKAFFCLFATILYFFSFQHGREFLPTTNSLAFFQLAIMILQVHPYYLRILDLLRRNQVHFLGHIPVLVYQGLLQISPTFRFPPFLIKPTLCNFWTS